MAQSRWKSAVPLMITLLVAFGLQAGAVKILMNLNQSTGEMGTSSAKAPSAFERVIDTEAIETVSEKRAAISETALAPSEHRPITTPKEPIPSETAPHTAPQQRTQTQNPEAAFTEPLPEKTKSVASSPEASPEAPRIVHSMPPVPATQNDANPEAKLAGGASPISETAPSEVPPIAPPPPPEKETTLPTAPISPTEAASLEKPAVGGLQDTAWIKARAPKNYTIQIYSGRDLEKLKEIATGITATVPASYFQTGSRNNPWYSLIVGDYPDAASARVASETMRAQSGGTKPWVRRFDDIQGSLR